MRTLSVHQFRQTRQAVYEAVLAGQPYTLTYHDNPVMYLSSWWQLAVVMDTCCEPSVCKQAFPTHQLASRWTYIKSLLKQFDVVRGYRYHPDNALALVAPEFFHAVRPDLAPVPPPPAMTASLTALARTTRHYIRHVARGAMVSVTERRYTIGYLVPDTRLANASLSRRESISATQLGQQAGLLLDLMEAGQGDIQPVTLAGVEVLALVPVRVWRRLHAS